MIATSHRPTLTCQHCQLVQFAPRSGRCRRCRQRIFESEHLLAGIACLLNGTGDPPPSAAGQIGRQITTLRQQAGLSQGQMALAMNTHRTHLSRIESGRVVPSLPTLERIAGALGMSLGELILHIQAPQPG